MQGTEVVVRAWLRKSVLVHELRVIKGAGITVRVTWRTKLPIGCARRPAGDAVKIARPGPAHSVANADDHGIRHKGEFVF